MWSEHYKVERVILGKNNKKNREVVLCKINFDNNSYIFKWDNIIIKNLSNYCNVDEALEEQSKENKLTLIWTIISIIILIIIIKFNLFNLY